MIGDTLYARQALMGDAVVPPESAMVIGVGGVGSYVALFLAMIGTRHIILIDPDTVEESNRNRVMFTEYDVGDYKVEAVASLIQQFRSGVTVVGYNKRVEDVPRDQLMAVVPPTTKVFDCRDSISPLPDYIPKCCITGGYDGTTVTMHVNPDLSKIFQVDEIRYVTTPSYCVPPVFIGAMVALYASSPKLHTDKEQISTFDMKELFGVMMNGKFSSTD